MVARRRGTRKLSNSTPLLRPIEADICVAIESLYADELKPVGRLLRRRLHELAVASTLADDGRIAVVPEVDSEHVFSVCKGCTLIHVEPEEGGDWSALLLGRPASYVNLSGPDEYPAEFWLAITSDLKAADAAASFEISGGRYACAQALFARSLPSLAGLSLGRISHIVQLAIAEKHILGYRSGEIVLYARSLSKAKEQSAICQQPYARSGQGVSEMAVASWEVARSCLESILVQAASEGTLGAVPLSRVKGLFRSEFGVDLSETSLGYSKLSDLLRDAHFSDICSVQLQDTGYIIYQKEQCALPDHMGEAHSQNCTDTSASCHSQRLVRRPIEPLSLGDDSSPSSGMVEPHIKNTFLHFSCTSPSPLAGNARRRASSVPRFLASSSDSDTDRCSDHFPSPRAHPFSPTLTASPHSVCNDVFPECSGDSPDALYFQSRGLTVSNMLCQCAHASKRICLRIDTKNTFVHAAIPSTPLQVGARRRARSVPADMRFSSGVDGEHAIDLMPNSSVSSPCCAPTPTNFFLPPTPLATSFLEYWPQFPFHENFCENEMLPDCQTKQWLAGFPHMVMSFPEYVDPMCSTADCSSDSADELTDACSTASSQRWDSSGDAVVLFLADALPVSGTELAERHWLDLQEAAMSSSDFLVAEPPHCSATASKMRWCDVEDDGESGDDAVLSEQKCSFQQSSVADGKERQRRRRHPRRRNAEGSVSMARRWR